MQRHTLEGPAYLDETNHFDYGAGTVINGEAFSVFVPEDNGCYPCIIEPQQNAALREFIQSTESSGREEFHYVEHRGTVYAERPCDDVAQLYPVDDGGVQTPLVIEDRVFTTITVYVQGTESVLRGEESVDSSYAPDGVVIETTSPSTKLALSWTELKDIIDSGDVSRLVHLNQFERHGL